MVLEGGLMSLIAGLAGGLAGSIAVLALARNPIDLSASLDRVALQGATMQPVIRAVVDWNAIVYPTLTMMLLGFVVSAIPAWRISRRRPVEALREY
jgi:ABC-type antimicrobial peptide transport system permease subunit